MNKEDILKTLTKDIPNSKVYINEPMKKHTSFKIGGNADIFVKANTREDVIYVLNFANTNNIPLTIVGNGSNLLVKDNGIRGITMQVSLDKIQIEDECMVKVGAGVKLGLLASTLANNEIAGFEFAAGIPGTIGGAVRMNAGAYGKEFKDIIEEVECLTRDGKIKVLKKENLDFSYRHSIICSTCEIVLSATLKLEKGNKEEIKQKMNEFLELRKEKQPIEFPSAGSTFKRGEDFITAKLIDEAGLKGYQIGGAQVSLKHAGFVVNKGNATAEDVLNLMEYITDTIYKKFEKRIEPEIEIIGE